MIFIIDISQDEVQPQQKQSQTLIKGGADVFLNGLNTAENVQDNNRILDDNNNNPKNQTIERKPHPLHG